MRKIDPVTIITYLLGFMFTLSLGLAMYDLYDQHKPLIGHLEAVEPIVKEDVYQPVEKEKIDETVVKSESTVVTYSPPAEEIVEPVEPEKRYFDVPLDEDLQDHIFEVCENYDLDPALLIAMIRKESTYRADTMGDNGRSYGLMQIQKRWHEARMEKLGVTDLLDPYQNVMVGADYLAEIIGYGRGLEWSLMAYNGGINYANKKTAAGTVSDYVYTVLEYRNELENVIK